MPAGRCERGPSLGRLRGAPSVAGVQVGEGVPQPAVRRAAGASGKALVLPCCCWAALSLGLRRSCRWHRPELAKALVLLLTSFPAAALKCGVPQSCGKYESEVWLTVELFEVAFGTDGGSFKAVSAAGMVFIAVYIRYQRKLRRVVKTGTYRIICDI